MASYAPSIPLNGQTNTIHIYYRSGHERLVATAADKQTVLYTVHRQTCKPHMSFYRSYPSPNGESALFIGTASFHHFKSDINVEVANVDIGMKKKGFMSNTYSFSAGPQGRWKWERDGALTSNLKLVDSHGYTIARFNNASWSVTKQGTFDILGMMDQLDLIMVSGLARVEYQRRSASTRNCAVIASGQ
jgi:hypothetical protein